MLNYNYPLELIGTVSSGVEAMEIKENALDFTSKLLHLAWHPTENLIACGVSNSLYMYYA